MEIAGTSGGIGAGLSALGKKYIYGADNLKSYGKKFTRVAGGAALGLAAGTIGMAAKIADGDLLTNPSDAATKIVGAAGIGYHAGGNLTGRLEEGASNLFETYKKGAMGVEAYNNSKFDKDFYKSDGYKQIAQDEKLLNAFGGESGIKAATQQFLDNGITDAAEIRKAMQKGVTGDELKEYSKLGIKAPEEIAAAKAKWGSATYYANLKKIASFAKNKSPEEFKAIISQIKIDGNNTPSTAEVDRIYENIIDLL